MAVLVSFAISSGLITGDAIPYLASHREFGAEKVRPEAEDQEGPELSLLEEVAVRCLLALPPLSGGEQPC